MIDNKPSNLRGLFYFVRNPNYLTFFVTVILDNNNDKNL